MAEVGLRSPGDVTVARRFPLVYVAAICGESGCKETDKQPIRSMFAEGKFFEVFCTGLRFFGYR